MWRYNSASRDIPPPARCYACRRVYTRVPSPSVPSVRLYDFSFFFLPFLLSLSSGEHDGDHEIVRGARWSLSFLRFSSFVLVSTLPRQLFLHLVYSFSLLLLSSPCSLYLDRSGKDPPRVALHEGVVDEESVKLALRQHYLAGYRYLGSLVISSRVRPTV